ncbi:MAG: type-F conjugative transfer system pilin assembly protein TrbC [Alphaproteobacteria bacterium]
MDRKRKISLGLMGAALFLAVPPNLPAQTEDEKERLREAVEDALPRAEAFAHDLRQAIEAANAQAQATVKAGDATVGRYTEGLSKGASTKQGFDLDALISEHGPAFAQAREAPMTQMPPLFVFASLAMPDESLARLFDDARRSGSVIVIRGFLEGSLKATAARIRELFEDESQISGVIIEPRLFKTFGITAVPAFVLAAGPLQSCTEPGCVSPPRPFDKVGGNAIEPALMPVRD